MDDEGGFALIVQAFYSVSTMAFIVHSPDSTFHWQLGFTYYGALSSIEYY